MLNAVQRAAGGQITREVHLLRSFHQQVSQEAVTAVQQARTSCWEQVTHCEAEAQARVRAADVKAHEFQEMARNKECEAQEATARAARLQLRETAAQQKASDLTAAADGAAAFKRDLDSCRKELEAAQEEASR